MIHLQHFIIHKDGIAITSHTNVITEDKFTYKLPLTCCRYAGYGQGWQQTFINKKTGVGHAQAESSHRQLTIKNPGRQFESATEKQYTGKLLKDVC